MIDLTPVLRFAVLVVRPGALISFSPIFGGTFAPVQVKVGLTVLTALALLPTTTMPAVGDALPLAIVIAREVAIGFALSLAIRVMAGGAEFAGQLAGFQLGLSYGATVDPQSGVRNPLLSVLYGNIAMVTFLMIGGHHAFLRALHHSYVDLPIGIGSVDASLPQTVSEMLGTVFQLGARLAAPIVIVLVFLEIAMALVARVTPMLNLMAVGAPLRLIVGLLILPVVAPAVVGLVSGSSDAIMRLAVRAAEGFR
jgi:flagellar biosynthetic protein FliR